MKNKPIHQPPLLLSKAKNELLFANKSLEKIEGLVGGTPFYVYDKPTILERVRRLKAALPESIKLHFAIKANPYPPVVNLLAGVVDGFDVASKKEMLLALQTSMPAKEISFAGPGKSDADLLAAIIAEITLHIESSNELHRAITIGKSVGIKPNIAIRVNPAFELKASGMKMAGGAKQFGIDEELLDVLLKDLPTEDVNLKGFHIFAGSQNLKAEALIDAHQKTFALAVKLKSLAPCQLAYINIGGGLGVPYFPGDTSLDLKPICANLQQLLNQHKELLGHTDIVMELGRYLVAEAGVYVCKVIDKKVSRGSTFLVCDGGLHHHLANSGNFGQVIRKNYPVAIGNKLNSEQLETVEIVGPLCTPLDILASKVDLPKANVGDYVVVFQSGAYGASASPQDFLSQKQLSELLL